MRGRIIGKIEEGRKITDLTRVFDIAHGVVFNDCGSHLKLLECDRRHRGCRVRSTTPAEDRYIVLSAERNRRTTAQRVANQFLAASGKQISRKLLPDVGGEEDYTHSDLFMCVSLTRQHRTARCNGVLSITIGLNRTGHAYYSQMRVGSVCHRIVNAN
ncbi:hypothetical protein TNCV_1293851 [Trichonephila clavipes]|nr:hypothetical protein TNCV_1293851 [Trichonephila clavipes]